MRLSFCVKIPAKWILRRVLILLAGLAVGKWYYSAMECVISWYFVVSFCYYFRHFFDVQLAGERQSIIIRSRVNRNRNFKLLKLDLNWIPGGIHGRFSTTGHPGIGQNWQQVAVSGRPSGMDVPSCGSSRSGHFHNAGHCPGKLSMTGRINLFHFPLAVLPVWIDLSDHVSFRLTE